MKKRETEKMLFPHFFPGKIASTTFSDTYITASAFSFANIWQTIFDYWRSERFLDILKFQVHIDIKNIRTSKY